MTTGHGEYILFYDGDCPLCNWVVLLLLRVDKLERFQYCPIESSQSRIILGDVEYQQLLAKDSVALYKDGRISYQSKAVVEALKIIPQFRILAYLAGLVPSFVGDSVYRFIAKRRRSLNIQCRPIPQSKRHLFLL